MPPDIRSFSALEREFSGRICLLEPNGLQIESLAVDFADSEARLTLQGPFSGCQEILLGRGQWAASQLKLAPGPSAADAVMSSFTWTADDVLQVTLLMVEQPFIFTLDITFREQSLTLIQSANVGMGAQEPVTIQGTLQA